MLHIEMIDKQPYKDKMDLDKIIKDCSNKFGKAFPKNMMSKTGLYYLNVKSFEKLDTFKKINNKYELLSFGLDLDKSISMTEFERFINKFADLICGISEEDRIDQIKNDICDDLTILDSELENYSHFIKSDEKFLEEIILKPVEEDQKSNEKIKEFKSKFKACKFDEKSLLKVIEDSRGILVDDAVELIKNKFRMQEFQNYIDGIKEILIAIKANIKNSENNFDLAFALLCPNNLPGTKRTLELDCTIDNFEETSKNWIKIMKFLVKFCNVQTIEIGPRVLQYMNSLVYKKGSKDFLSSFLDFFLKDRRLFKFKFGVCNKKDIIKFVKFMLPFTSISRNLYLLLNNKEISIDDFRDFSVLCSLSGFKGLDLSSNTFCPNSNYNDFKSLLRGFVFTDIICKNIGLKGDIELLFNHIRSVLDFSDNNISSLKINCHNIMKLTLTLDGLNLSKSQFRCTDLYLFGSQINMVIQGNRRNDFDKIIVESIVSDASGFTMDFINNNFQFIGNKRLLIPKMKIKLKDIKNFQTTTAKIVNDGTCKDILRGREIALYKGDEINKIVAKGKLGVPHSVFTDDQNFLKYLEEYKSSFSCSVNHLSLVCNNVNDVIIGYERCELLKDKKLINSFQLILRVHSKALNESNLEVLKLFKFYPKDIIYLSDMDNDNDDIFWGNVENYGLFSGNNYGVFLGNIKFTPFMYFAGFDEFDFNVKLDLTVDNLEFLSAKPDNLEFLSAKPKLTDSKSSNKWIFGFGVLGVLVVGYLLRETLMQNVDNLLGVNVDKNSVVDDNNKITVSDNEVNNLVDINVDENSIVADNDKIAVSDNEVNNLVDINVDENSIVADNNKIAVSDNEVVKFDDDYLEFK